MVLHTLKIFQVPLPPSVTTSRGCIVAICGRTGLSVGASRRQQARYGLAHILSVAYLTDSPLIVKAFTFHLSSITQLCAAKRADL